MSGVLWKMSYIFVQHHVKTVITSDILSLVLKSYGRKVLQKSVIFTTSTQRQSLAPEPLNSHKAGGAVSSVQHYDITLSKIAVLSLMSPQACQHTGISMPIPP
jgi:hypothetical protein